MGIVTDWLVLDTSEGPMRMFIARPEGGVAGPGLLVVQDTFGLTDHLQEVCCHFADEGFVALAPELYHSLAARRVPYDDVATAESLRSQRSDDQLMDDLYVAFRFLGNRGEVRSGLVGAVGYGVGGRDAFLLAARYPDVLALVTYYASLAPDAPPSPIDAAPDLLAPALLFFGEADDSIPAAEVERVRDCLTDAGVDHEIVTYPDAGQGFACEAQPDAYDPKAAVDAWTRTVDFLYERLEG